MRVTQRDRDRILTTLKSSSIQGALSTDTFERRVESALSAKTSLQLRGLVADLPVRTLKQRTLDWLATRRDPLAPISVRLPPSCADQDVFVIGRSSRCQLVIDDPSVSRQHISLRRLSDGRWNLVDLQSTNGVLVNGWRVRRTVVEAGDTLSLGTTTIVLAD